MKKAIIILFMAMPWIAKSQTSEIKGVVTYYFNQYQGDKPDIGAKVFISKADSTQAKGNFIDDYRKVSTLRALVEQTKKKQRDSLYYKRLEMLKRLAVDTDDGYSKYGIESFDKLMKLQQNPNTISLVVDGSGNYSTKVEPGFYQVIIQSNGRKSFSMLEITGKLAVKVVEVKANQSSLFNYKFDVY